MSESCMLSLYHSGLPNNPYAEYDAAFCSNATLAINQTSCETTYWPMCEWRSSSATAQCALKEALEGTFSESFSALCDTMAGDAFGCETYFSEWCDATYPASSSVVKCWPKYGKNAYAPFCAVTTQSDCESSVRSTYCEWGPEPTADDSASKCRTVNSNYTAICNMYFDDQASCQLFEASATDQSESALCQWTTNGAQLGDSCASSVCGSGLFCISDICKTEVLDGEDCSAPNTFCSSGLTCAGGICQTELAAGGDCSAPNTYCGGSLTCHSNTCQNELNVGEADCTAANTYCAAGLICESSVCAVPLKLYGLGHITDFLLQDGTLPDQSEKYVDLYETTNFVSSDVATTGLVVVNSFFDLNITEYCLDDYDPVVFAFGEADGQIYLALNFNSPSGSGFRLTEWRYQVGTPTEFPLFSGYDGTSTNWFTPNATTDNSYEGYELEPVEQPSC